MRIISQARAGRNGEIITGGSRLVFTSSIATVESITTDRIIPENRVNREGLRGEPAIGDMLRDTLVLLRPALLCRPGRPRKMARLI